ncbi:MAG TPA: ATP synthase F1 subunit gamma [Candidatus Dojkabacteria bacterium]|nr:ATP synthase F1 subunit gamma [Candidatus Dojkabacteria bacterium]
MSINTKAVKSRIQSVKNTSKVTRSMEKISTVKKAKFASQALQSKKYSNELFRTNDIFADTLEISEGSSPILQKRSLDTTMVVVFTSDRGLCGSFNSNVINVASRYISDLKIKDPSRVIKLTALGKKGVKIANAIDGLIVDGVYEKLYEGNTYDRCYEISRTLVNKYLVDECDEVILIYTAFQSFTSQNIVIEKILPFKKPIAEDVEVADYSSKEVYQIEPSVEALQEYIFLKTLDTKIYQALLESSASEHTSRMMAMKNASDNASDLTSLLNLTYNKGRQAAITQEVSEIVAGIEALVN